MPGVPEGNAAISPGALGATWDTRNRLTALTGAAGWRAAFSATYAYDAEGNRISKTVGGQTTSWTINPHGAGGLSQVLVETAPGGAKKFFVHGPTGLLYDVDTAATPNVRHFHTDQVGSTVALTNAGGAVIGRAEYSAYGMVSYREGDTATPFLYNGAYGVMTDAESGLLNMRARYYHPWIGRFASPDPIGFSGGMNWFAYCDGNPISKMDPFGLQGLIEIQNALNPGLKSTTVDCFRCHPDPATLRKISQGQLVADIAERIVPVIGARNAYFLGHWASGELPSQIYYSPNSPESRDMMRSGNAEAMRDAFYANNAQTTRNIPYGTGRAFVETVGTLNSTAFQVGGTVGSSVVNNGDGTATFNIMNVAGTKSFYYHLASDRTSPTGEMHNVTQNFQWKEPIYYDRVKKP
jgi:RHS repeat-associated protein